MPIIILWNIKYDKWQFFGENDRVILVFFELLFLPKTANNELWLKGNENNFCMASGISLTAL